MGIIEEYDSISKEKLGKEQDIVQYKNELDTNITRLSNFKANNTLFTLLLHPIRTIRVKKELQRLENTRNTFQRALDASIVMYMYEESGILEEDLIHAMEHSKPKYLRKFMAKNPVKKISKDRKSVV